MIIKTISKQQFIEDMQNSEYKDEYNPIALQAIYYYLDNQPENIEFDPIMIATTWKVYPTAWEAMEQYQPEDMPTPYISDDENPDLMELQEKEEQMAMEWLKDHTEVITFTGGIIINRNF